MRVAVGLVIVTVSSARADEKATSPARPDYQASDKALTWEGRRDLEDEGLTIDGTYSVDLYAAPQLQNRFASNGLFTFEIDALDRVHISAFAIHGGGITSELGELHGLSGNVATEEIRLFEAWYEQPLGPLIIRAGLVAADQELVIADHSQLLLAATFGMTTHFAYNALAPIYPIAAPGLSARVERDDIGGRLAVYDGSQPNTNGVPTGLGPETLVLGEIHLVEHFKLGAWHHTSLGDGFYAIADAELAPELGTFARLGYSSEGPIRTYIDAGVRATPSWRTEDLVSVGVAFAHAEMGAETIVEATYELQIRWLSIQPDVQMILMRDRTVGVGMMRLTVTL